MGSSDNPLEGACTCGAIRYRLDSKPLFVHCCHCTWCQRETGSAFALNAIIEADRVTVIRGNPVPVTTPSSSGEGQTIWRCKDCHIALWSNYSGAGKNFHFVRVGTLDQPNMVPPDIHIFTASKQDWVILPDGSLAVGEYYDRVKCWPKESLLRRERFLGHGT